MNHLWLVRKRRMKPEKVNRVAAACELVLTMLCVKDWNDPIADIVARRVVTVEETGIQEPTEIAALVMKQLI